MKLVITSDTPKINSPIERRFGRRAYFLVIDTETRALEALPDPAAEAMDLSGGSTGSCLWGAIRPR